MALKDILHAALVGVILQNVSFRSANVIFAQSFNEIRKDPAIYYTTVELACSEGYPIQEHEIVTKDGYILTLHRIPNGRTRLKVARSKKHYLKIHLNHHPDFDDCVKESLNETSVGLPVVFVHGVLMASDGWLLQGSGYDLDDSEGKSLNLILITERNTAEMEKVPPTRGCATAYLMADRGFDVWLFNVRGNFYSRKHKTLNPSDPKFWDFSFHENGIFDLPAAIDYILKLTKKDKIGYLGYSMGTTIFFAMASTLPEYNDKILGFLGFAPVAFMREENMSPRRKTLFGVLSRLTKELERRGDVHELLPRSTRLVYFGKNYCSKGSQLQDFCYDLIASFLGYNSRLVLRNKLHLYVTHLPTGTSIKTFIHFIQNSEGNCFRPFDYGIAINYQLYGSATPPDYPLSNITVPVALYYSVNDFYYDVRDINDLRKLLPNVIDIDIKSKFNHGDYLWSFKARDNLYPKVLTFFKKLNDQYYMQYSGEKISTETAL